MINRPNWIETFMEMAEVISKRSVMRTKVGAVLVQDRRVVSIGYNGKPAGAVDIFRTSPEAELDDVHAEVNCIAFAARVGIKTQGSTLYSTVAPCIHCAKTIIQAGVKMVYSYDKRAINQEACPDGIDLLKAHGVVVRFVSNEE